MSISDFLTLFSSRTQGFFWTSAPAPLLTGAALFSLSLSTLLACVWPSSHAERNLPVRGLSRSGYKVWPLWVWIYCLVWCVLRCPAPICGCHGYILSPTLDGRAPCHQQPTRALHTTCMRNSVGCFQDTWSTHGLCW